MTDIRCHAYRMLLTFAILAAPGLAGEARAQHPLDPLSAGEIGTATAVVRQDARLAAADLPLILLEEPPKAAVLAWRPGQRLPRLARAVATTPGTLFEAIVDVDARRLVSVTERKGAQGPVTLPEIERATEIVVADSRMRDRLRARGLTDPSKLFCAPWSAGYFGVPAYEGRRVLVVGCFDTRRTTNNMFGWPVERLFAVVDLFKREVIEVVDNGEVPITPTNQNFKEADVEALRAARRPTLTAQPEGASYTIDGNEVSWGPWRFHVRLDPRVGPVVSLARWRDGSRDRSILYQGYLSEMFVPYMDPDFGWYSRTFFDVGEYGAGLLALPLVAGVDCPATATYLPATFSTDRGEPMTTPRAMCIFERDRGEPIWRHGAESRRDVELVVRVTVEVGNYDYILDWVFNDAAEIDVRVGATGIVALKGVKTQHMSEPGAAADTRYGTLVAAGLVGANHDHHFNFRLDLDVDGTANSFAREGYHKQRTPAGAARKSLYVVTPEVTDTEQRAAFDGGHGVQKLMVVNEDVSNGVGNRVGYELLYGNHGDKMLDPDDWPGRRARFLDHDLWVTRHDAAERYAAGDYPFGNPGDGAGLPAWVEKNRSVRKQDLVVWANLSLHHLVRAEDLPVMPTLWHSFKLRPFNFFDRNPAVDLPSEPAAATPSPDRRR
jgi:primary-amine oxidase